MSAPAASAAGKVALVTGGARGIGAAIAEGLRARGARVAILDVDAAALVACPSDRLKIAADIAGPAACEAAVRQVDDAHGQLDVLVNNADLGMGPIGANHLAQPVGLTEITPEHWRPLFEVNAWAPFSWRARRCPRWRRAAGAG